ncbi:MAG: hypothetical protein IJM34_12055 [Lachnospiraceae bacterium]|nr:hypothetical protein [Lachnospiraceae bacterium]
MRCDCCGKEFSENKTKKISLGSKEYRLCISCNDSIQKVSSGLISGEDVIADNVDYIVFSLVDYIRNISKKNTSDHIGEDELSKDRTIKQMSVTAGDYTDRKTGEEGADFMFDEVGSKIKTVAKISCWIGIVSAIFIGFLVMSFINDFIDGIGRDENSLGTIVGLVIIVVGSFVSWLLSLCVYGFGELVDNSSIIAKNSGGRSPKDRRPVSRDLNALPKEMKTVELPVNDTKEDDNAEEEYIDLRCPYCDDQISYTKQFIKNSKTLICPMCGESFQSKLK